MNIRDGGEKCVMSTQEYIKKVVEDENFKRGSWVSAIEYVNANGGIMSGCLGDIKNFLKNGKLDQGVAIVKSCTLNVLGDLTVTLKDLTENLYKFNKEALNLALEEEARQARDEQSSTRVETSTITQEPIRIIPGPASIVQAAKLLKQTNIQDGGEECVMSTQEYIKKVIGDVCEDEDFKRDSWVRSIKYVNDNGGIVSGYLGDIKNFLKNEKLDQVVVIIKSCTLNVFGDLTVTLKDLTGTIVGSIHHKVIDEGVMEMILLTRVETSTTTQNPFRIIHGPAGIVKAPKLLKQTHIRDGGEEFVMSTQEYIKKIVRDMGEDEDFKRGSWVSVIKYVNANGGIVSGCLGDIKNFLKNEKLNQVVAIVKSYTLNVLGGLIVTLKDLSGTIDGSIPHKVIDEEGYGNDIIVGPVLILANVLVFSPKPSIHYPDITIKNVVKIFHKDMVPKSGSGVGESGILDEEKIMKLLREEEMIELELQVCGNVIVQEDLYKFDEEALNLTLEEEAMQARAGQEWFNKYRQEQELDEEHKRHLWGFYV
nr:hypothetical protein [Tanacetum cinerariifolium]